MKGRKPASLFFFDDIKTVMFFVIGVIFVLNRFCGYLGRLHLNVGHVHFLLVALSFHNMYGFFFFLDG